MGLEVPDLDDREFEAFLEDARKRIPVHDETWTDHNDHDPGITFLELFAWIAETDDYRLDRLTDDHAAQFLRLVGVGPRAPQRSRTRLQVSLPDGLDSATVRDGEPLVARAGPESVESFRASGETVLTGATVDAVVSVRGDGRSDATAANATEGMYYRAFGDAPAAGDALYLGFRTDPFATATRLDLDVAYHDADLPDRASHGDESVTFEPSHRVVWEYYVPADHAEQPYALWYDDERWTAFGSAPSGPSVVDGTTHLYGSGTVSLPAPTDWLDEPGVILGADQPHYWVRCRLARRDPPDPSPACDAPAAPADPPGVHYEVPPQLAAVRTNVVTAAHAGSRPDHVADDCATSAADVALERRSGPETTARPDQQFHFERAPVQSATVTVGGTAWQEVPSFADSGPDDRHYVLDRGAGTVRFGDGVQGTVPGPGQSVVAADPVFGGGTDGNVPDSAEWTFDCDRLAGADISSLGAARGGVGAESVDAALGRARERRRTPFRAVTRSDYSYLATHTPGLRFGRAAVLTETEGRGQIRVVVLPYSPPDVVPVPSEGYLDAVDCHLRRHALLTDDVTAVAPTYVDVSVRAEIRVADGAVPARRQQAGEQAVREFLDPLRGFEGDGWPFGRPVYHSELYELLEETAGIETVVDVDVTTAGAVDLETSADALPALEDVDVQVLAEPDDCGRGF